MSDLKERIQHLEEKFAFQEQTLDTLDEVILEQQAQINTLEEQLVKLKELFSSLLQETEVGEDPPPPHY